MSKGTEQLRANLDLLEEIREYAQVWIAAYQCKVARYYNSQVKRKVFKVDDLVLQRAEIS